jgi:hypothetical protein
LRFTISTLIRIITSDTTNQTTKTNKIIWVSIIIKTLLTFALRRKRSISIHFARKTRIWIITGLASSITFIAFRVSIYFVVKHWTNTKRWINSGNIESGARNTLGIRNACLTLKDTFLTNYLLNRKIFIVSILTKTFWRVYSKRIFNTFFTRWKLDTTFTPIKTLFTKRFKVVIVSLLTVA